MYLRRCRGCCRCTSRSVARCVSSGTDAVQCARAMPDRYASLPSTAARDELRTLASAALARSEWSAHDLDVLWYGGCIACVSCSLAQLQLLGRGA